MKLKMRALFLALGLLLASCAPHDTQEISPTQQPELPNALETEAPEPTITVKPAETVRYDSMLGCSAAYDPIFFTAEDVVDEYSRSAACFSIQSIEEINSFPVRVCVTPLDAISAEEAVSDMLGSQNLDDFLEETAFGAGRYAAIHLTYHDVYAVGDIYVTEQNGAVFSVEVSSYYQPSRSLLARAYAVLDSITF